MPVVSSTTGNVSEALAAAIKEIKALYPGWPHAAQVALARAYLASGDMDLAVAAMRNAENYDRWFAGNRRRDGTVRFDEATYMSVRREFRASVLALGINPDLFDDEFVRAIKGEVSPRELFAKMNTVAERVLRSAPEIKAEYARFYGLQLTDEALIASALSPKVSEAILNRRIGISEVGAAASTSGFALTRAVATRLQQFGIDWATGREVFGQAAEELPLLDALQRRHDDPEDDFDLNTFLSAAVFNDPNERRKIRNLIAAEEGMFTDELGTIALSEEGGLSGYQPR